MFIVEQKSIAVLIVLLTNLTVYNFLVAEDLSKLQRLDPSKVVKGAKTTVKFYQPAGTMTYGIALPARYRENGEPLPLIYVSNGNSMIKGRAEKAKKNDASAPVHERAVYFAGDWVDVGDKLNAIMIQHEAPLPSNKEGIQRVVSAIVKDVESKYNIHPTMRYIYEPFGDTQDSYGVAILQDESLNFAGAYLKRNPKHESLRPGLFIIHENNNSNSVDQGNTYEDWGGLLKKEKSKIYFDLSLVGDRHLNFADGMAWLIGMTLLNSPSITNEERDFYFQEFTDFIDTNGNAKQGSSFARAMLEVPGLYATDYGDKLIDLYNRHMEDLIEKTREAELVYQFHNYLVYSPMNKKKKDVVKKHKDIIKELKKSADKDLKKDYKTIDAFIKLWAKGQSIELAGKLNTKNTEKLAAALESIANASDKMGSRAAKRYAHRLRHLRN